MKLYYCLITFLLVHVISFSQSVSIDYSRLKDAFDSYDTLFFNSLKGEEVDIMCNDKYIRRGKPGDSFVPYIDWYLNKKADLTEFDFNLSDSILLIVIYENNVNKQITYKVKFIGSNPQVRFKRGKHNWYKIKSLKNSILIETEKKVLFSK